MKKVRKINVRLTAQLDNKLQEFVKASGSSMSSIVVKSIEQFLRQGATYSCESPYEIAKRTGIIGKYNKAPKGLSVKYKAFLEDSLSKKY